MAIPTLIIINGIDIPIFQVKHLIRDYSRYGEFSSADMSITLDKDMSDQKKELILCHEIIEAIIDIYALDVDHKSIQPLAAAFYHIIKTKQVEF